MNNTVENTLCFAITSNALVLLGLQGHVVLPLVDLPVCPFARKIWITYTQAYMPYESSEDSSNQPDGPMGYLRHPT